MHKYIYIYKYLYKIENGEVENVLSFRCAHLARVRNEKTLAIHESRVYTVIA
jgi:hypothetical protein